LDADASMPLMLALALLLTACAASGRPDIPPELRACPGPAEAPPRLGKLITVEVLRARYYAERAARLEDEDALQTCAQRLARVLALIGK
jgi:hypothetical protein